MKSKTGVCVENTATFIHHCSAPSSARRISTLLIAARRAVDPSRACSAGHSAFSHNTAPIRPPEWQVWQNENASVCRRCCSEAAPCTSVTTLCHIAGSLRVARGDFCGYSRAGANVVVVLLKQKCAQDHHTWSMWRTTGVPAPGPCAALYTCSPNTLPTR